MNQPREQEVPPRLALAHISKNFPGVKANDDISLSVKPGEIHALLGENGAGKSTLVKIIYGVQQADEGTISWNGEAVAIPSPKAARKLGIGMVFQHFSLFDAMTVIENIALGLDEAVDREELKQRVAAILQSYSLPLDPEREVHTLSVGERQRIEIVRCLLQKPKLLIMDEPTSVLTPQEVEKLFETLRRLAREGVAILYISHKLDEIRALCETATIMRLCQKLGFSGFSEFIWHCKQLLSDTPHIAAQAQSRPELPVLFNQFIANYQHTFQWVTQDKRQQFSNLLRQKESFFLYGAGFSYLFAEYLTKKLGVKSVYSIDDAEAYGQGLAKELDADLTAAGVKVTHDGLPQGTKPGPEAAKVVQSGADAVYYSGYYADGGPLAKALRSAGYKGVFMSDDGTKDPNFIKLAGADAAEGAYFTCPCADPSKAADFFTAYKAAFNQEAGTYSAEAYDVANAIISAMKGITGDITRESVATAVAGVDYQGVTKDVSFGSNHELKTTTVYLYQVVNGTIKYLGAIDDLV